MKQKKWHNLIELIAIQKSKRFVAMVVSMALVVTLTVVFTAFEEEGESASDANASTGLLNDLDSESDDGDDTHWNGEIGDSVDLYSNGGQGLIGAKKVIGTTTSDADDSNMGNKSHYAVDSRFSQRDSNGNSQAYADVVSLDYLSEGFKSNVQIRLGGFNFPRGSTSNHCDWQDPDTAKMAEQLRDVDVPEDYIPTMCYMVVVPPHVSLLSGVGGMFFKSPLLEFAKSPDDVFKNAIDFDFDNFAMDSASTNFVISPTGESGLQASYKLQVTAPQKKYFLNYCSYHAPDVQTDYTCTDMKEGKLDAEPLVDTEEYVPISGMYSDTEYQRFPYEKGTKSPISASDMSVTLLRSGLENSYGGNEMINFGIKFEGLDLRNFSDNVYGSCSLDSVSADASWTELTKGKKCNRTLDKLYVKIKPSVSRGDSGKLYGVPQDDVGLGSDFYIPIDFTKTDSELQFQYETPKSDSGTKTVAFKISFVSIETVTTCADDLIDENHCKVGEGSQNASSKNTKQYDKLGGVINFDSFSINSITNNPIFVNHIAEKDETFKGISLLKGETAIGYGENNYGDIVLKFRKVSENEILNYSPAKTLALGIQKQNIKNDIIWNHFVYSKIEAYFNSPRITAGSANTLSGILDSANFDPSNNHLLNNVAFAENSYFPDYKQSTRNKAIDVTKAVLGVLVAVMFVVPLFEPFAMAAVMINMVVEYILDFCKDNKVSEAIMKELSAITQQIVDISRMADDWTVNILSDIGKNDAIDSLLQFNEVNNRYNRSNESIKADMIYGENGLLYSFANSIGMPISKDTIEDASKNENFDIRTASTQNTIIDKFSQDQVDTKFDSLVSATADIYRSGGLYPVGSSYLLKKNDSFREMMELTRIIDGTNFVDATDLFTRYHALVGTEYNWAAQTFAYRKSFNDQVFQDFSNKATKELQAIAYDEALNLAESEYVDQEIIIDIDSDATCISNDSCENYDTDKLIQNATYKENIAQDYFKLQAILFAYVSVSELYSNANSVLNKEIELATKGNIFSHRIGKYVGLKNFSNPFICQENSAVEWVKSTFDDGDVYDRCKVKTLSSASSLAFGGDFFSIYSGYKPFECDSDEINKCTVTSLVPTDGRVAVSINLGQVLRLGEYEKMMWAASFSSSGSVIEELRNVYDILNHDYKAHLSLPDLDFPTVVGIGGIELNNGLFEAVRASEDGETAITMSMTNMTSTSRVVTGESFVCWSTGTDHPECDMSMPGFARNKFGGKGILDDYTGSEKDEYKTFLTDTLYRWSDPRNEHYRQGLLMQGFTSPPVK